MCALVEFLFCSDLRFDEKKLLSVAKSLCGRIVFLSLCAQFFVSTSREMSIVLDWVVSCLFFFIKFYHSAH